jgi:hypothetical protein
MRGFHRENPSKVMVSFGLSLLLGKSQFSRDLQGTKNILKKTPAVRSISHPNPTI